MVMGWTGWLAANWGSWARTSGGWLAVVGSWRRRQTSTHSKEVIRERLELRLELPRTPKLLSCYQTFVLERFQVLGRLDGGWGVGVGGLG